ncbi:MAG TPA: glycosyltransferase family 39 protein [Blastocatellia bacterium]|nr:glycosyltransferase family 39 protein [Blastocatellia bacterium]
MLPNEEGDAYSYLRAIESLRAGMSGGTFAISDLFGFWLPIYQLICALISLLVGQPLLVAKLISALCGIGVCILVFRISLQLTGNRNLSLLAFALIAFNPIHIMYSSFSMTDVPHAFLVICSLYFAIKKRWLLAACFVAVGSLMRVESWPLILLLPVLQWLLERRVSLTSCCIAFVGPLFWLYICWAATGNPFEYFEVRSSYVNAVRDTSFSLSRVAVSVGALAYSVNPALVLACLTAGWVIVKRMRERREWRISESRFPILATIAFFVSSLGFVLLSYVTNNQPGILPRYGLIMFALGIPVLSWSFLVARDWKRPRVLGYLVIAAALCLSQWSLQLVNGVAFVNHVAQKRAIADYLKGEYQTNPGLNILCPDSTVRVLSGIPEGRFIDSSNCPDKIEPFLAYLKENRVEYVIFDRMEGVIPASPLAELGEMETRGLVQPVIRVDSTRYSLGLWKCEM